MYAALLQLREDVCYVQWLRDSNTNQQLMYWSQIFQEWLGWHHRIRYDIWSIGILPDQCELEQAGSTNRY